MTNLLIFLNSGYSRRRKMQTILASDERFMPEFKRWLWSKNERIPNYKRQEETCKVMTAFLSPLGTGEGERVMLVGSTRANTRIQCDHDEGDFDYLIMSETRIPVSALEFSPDLRCFVHIRGEELLARLPCSLVDGKYVPTDMVREIKAPAFYQARGIYEFVSHPSIKKADKIQIDVNINPGKSLETFHGFECREFDIPNDWKAPDQALFAQRFHQKLLEDPVFRENLDTLVQFNRTVNLISGLQNIINSRSERQNSPLKEYEFVVEGLTKAMNGGFNFGNAERNSSANSSESTSGHRLGSATCDRNSPETKRQRVQADDELEEEIVYASYAYKATKDFIGAFPIQGDLPDMEKWAKRSDRKWPDCNMVQEVSKCEIFLVCKPEASDNPNPEIDFCLAFTLAELKLAEHMTRGQKECILMIKALTSGVLSSYSSILTSFHWKTVVFWLSEIHGADAFNEKFPIPVLDMVLEYMETCLKKKYLEHYFVKSNLISGRKFTDNVMETLLRKIQSIRQKPIQALKSFYVQEEHLKGKRKQIVFPRRKIEELKRTLLDPSPEVFVDTKIEALKYLLKDHRPLHLTQGQPPFCEKLKDALKKFTEAALPMWAEEEASRSNINVSPELIQTGLQLANQFMNTNSENREQNQQALQDLGGVLLNLFGKKGHR